MVEYQYEKTLFKIFYLQYKCKLKCKLNIIKRKQEPEFHKTKVEYKTLTGQYCYCPAREKEVIV
jgi:hypothetical protein